MTMKRIVSYTMAIVTDALGAAEVYFGKKTAISGRIVAIKYVPGGVSGLATGADLTLTGETTGVPVLIKANAAQSTVWYYPGVIPNLNTSGAAFTDVAADIFVVKERIKLVVAQGGNTLTGSMTIYVEEDTVKRMHVYSQTILIPAAVTTVTVYFGAKTAIRGRVHAIHFVIGTLDATCVLTITGETTGVPILTDDTPAGIWYYPRVLPNKNTDGSAFTDVAADIFVGTADAGERIKLIVTSATAAQTGTMKIYVEEEV
jgi:hypothetical protein